MYATSHSLISDVENFVAHIVRVFLQCTVCKASSAAVMPGTCNTVSQGSSVSVVPDYGLDARGSIPDRIFPLTSASRRALGPTQPPVQWVPGALSPGVKRGRGVMLTTHPFQCRG
jgi:hypothetical protein